MITPVTWAHLTYMNSTEQSKIAVFEQIGRDLAKFRNGQGPPPDLTNITYSAAKGGEQSMRALHDLINWAEEGIRYVKQKHKEQVDATDEANNPAP